MKRRKKPLGAVCIFGIILLVATLAGCETAPHDVVPNLSAIVKEFAKAKALCECHRNVIKSHLLPRRQKEGSDLYADAMGVHNGAISAIIIALGDPAGSMSENELRSMLVSCDEKTQRFLDPFKNPEDKSTFHECSSHGEVIGALADLTTEILKLVNAHNEAVREQRRTVIDQLEKCKWEPW